MKCSVVVIVFMFALATGAARAEDVESIVSDCNGCHGPHGASGNDDVPIIGGISSFVLSDALLAYKDNARPCPASKYRYGDTERPGKDMCAVAKDLSEAQIDAVAEFYAGKPFVPAKQEVDAARAAAGQKLAEAHCAKCHSAGGSNPDDDASILAGQWMGYLRHSLEEFKTDKREQPENMKAKLDEVSADDLAAIVEYYGSQQ
jgi:cytochrome subunit of sulfide dehydrogenase